MSCINKANRAYKALYYVYGDNLAEAFVRGYPTNKGKSEDMEFYIPNKVEVKAWLTEQKRNIPAYINRALEINPYLSEKGIKSMLKGVVARYDDKYYVASGWLFAGSTAMSSEVLETIYKPNLAVMRKLESMFPDIFTVKDTSNPYNTLVEINPRQNYGNLFTESEELEEDELKTDEPEITESVRTYQELVQMNGGRKPVEFMAGNLKWQLNSNGLYNLVDKRTNDIYLRNFDLEVGEIVPDTTPDSPASEEKRDRIFRSVMQMIKDQKFDEYLAVKGIDTADIYEDLRYAQTDRDLNKVLEKLLKAIC